MKSIWAKLELIAKKSGKTLGLQKGNSETSIAAAEKILNFKFPEDFRESLLLHNGQNGDPMELFEWIPGCSPLAPLKSIIEQWGEEKESFEPEEKLKSLEKGLMYNVMFHPKRIPIAGTPYWDGDNTYLDLIPGPKGTKGQLITMVSECDFIVLGKSFKEALETYVAVLDSGKWKYPKDERTNVSYEYYKFLKKWKAKR
ncbi:MAG: SMI1/KNR4 family protein [Anaerolineales bacterium]